MQHADNYIKSKVSRHTENLRIKQMTQLYAIYKKLTSNIKIHVRKREGFFLMPYQKKKKKSNKT